MRTAKGHQMGRTRFASVKGEIVAHDANWLGSAALEVLRPVDRVPEKPHVAAGQRTRPGPLRVDLVAGARRVGGPITGEGHGSSRKSSFETHYSRDQTCAFRAMPPTSPIPA